MIPWSARVAHARRATREIFCLLSSRWVKTFPFEMEFPIVYEKDRERFLNKVHKTDFCWIWTSKISEDGMPLFWINKELYPAHYFAYQLANNLVSFSGKIERVCSSKLCVNPGHLKLYEDPVQYGDLSYERICSIILKEQTKYTDSEIGNVYFIQCGIDGPIKIGWSKEPQQSLQQLQKSNPFELKLLHSYESLKCEETILHKIFSDFHIRNEWFRADDSIKKFVADKRKEIQLTKSSE